MATRYEEIEELLKARADLEARLRLLPYDGTPEMKTQAGKRYLYVRKRVGAKHRSTYVGPYDEELHNLLLRNSKEAREIRKALRSIDKKLLSFGYSKTELPLEVARNIDFARINMKANIYDQAVLEGIATSFPETEEIIESGMAGHMSVGDIQKIINLKHAWEFILDEDVIMSRTDYYVLSYVARLVNEGLLYEGGRIRGVPVKIGGSSYVPPLPIEQDVKEKIDGIVESKASPIDIAVKLCLFCMKSQIFLDGNKRASVIFANHYLIGQAGGFLVIPEKEVPEFKRLLIRYYEEDNEKTIADFIKERCWKALPKD